MSSILNLAISLSSPIKPNHQKTRDFQSNSPSLKHTLIEHLAGVLYGVPGAPGFC